jgi:snRNA-activating protein complex subunit 3
MFAHTQAVAEYPLLIFQSKQHMRKCSVCATFLAKLVTHHDRLAPASPAFFCQQCYDFLHKDADGNVLYQGFQVFPYYHE